MRWIRFSPILCFYSTSYLQFVKDIASSHISTHGIWSSIPQNFSQGTRQDVCTIRGCFRRSGRFYPVDQFSPISCFWKSDLQSGEGCRQSEHNIHSWDLELYTPKPFLGHQTRSIHNMRWFSKVWKVLSNGSDFHRFHVFAQNLTFNLVKISPARTYPPMGSGDCILKTFLRAPDKQCTQYKVVPERRECFIRWIRFRRFCVFELISMFTSKGTSALTKIHSWDLNLWTPKLL